MPLCGKCEVWLPGTLGDTQQTHPSVPADEEGNEQGALDIEGLEGEAGDC